MQTIDRLKTSLTRAGLTWDETWRSDDQGLIKCWENGRVLSATRPDLAEAARRDELPTLEWKGGVAGTPKMKKKFGSLRYLATWQGLRGEDLRVDTTEEVSLMCVRTGVLVTFTADLVKLDSDSMASEETESPEQ